MNSNFTPSLKTLILKQACSEASQVTKSWNLGDTTHPDIHCPQVEMPGQGWDCWWKDMRMYNLTGADRFQMEKAVAGTVPTAVSQGGCCLAPSLARGFLSLVRFDPSDDELSKAIPAFPEVESPAGFFSHLSAFHLPHGFAPSRVCCPDAFL